MLNLKKSLYIFIIIKNINLFIVIVGGKMENNIGKENIIYKFYLLLNFIVYLLFINVFRIKLRILKIKNKKAADRYAYKLARDISNYAIKLTKTKMKVIGEENIPEGACVFISNHQGNFDAFIFASIVKKGTGSIAKKQIKKIPIVGAIFKEVHSVFIDRNNVRDGLRAINEAAENIKKGYSITIFPEGTRSRSYKVGNFKKGSFKLALKANATIVPVSINGTYKVMENGDRVTGNKVSIIFHEPIFVDKLSKEEKKDLSERVRVIICNGVNQLLANE